MCSCAAQADGLGTEAKRELSVFGIVGVHAHMVRVRAARFETNLVRPSKNRLEVARELDGDERHGAKNDDALRAVDRDDVALVEHDVRTGDASLLRHRVDMDSFDAADAGRAHAAGDNGRVARLAAVARKDAFGCDHALEVVGIRLPTHEDARTAPLPPQRPRRRS